MNILYLVFLFYGESMGKVFVRKLLKIFLIENLKKPDLI